MKNLALHRAREQGNALLTTALAIVLLVAVGGAAIDLGRQQLLHSRLQQSSDAAALAGALAPTGSTPSDTANRYFALNYAINDSQSYMGSTTTPTISTDNGVKVSANGAVHNQFISTLGTTSSQAAGATTVSTTSGNTAQKYDVIVIMDNSMSMNSNDVTAPDGTTESRVQATKNAVAIIANNLLGDNDASDSRIGAIAYYWTVDSDRVLEPTGDLTTFTNYLAGARMGPGFGTDSSQGTAIARSDVSTHFRPDAIHVVILLTDGDNNVTGGHELGGNGGNHGDIFNLIVSDAYADQQQTPAQMSDAETLSDCSYFKGQTPATIVYTIGFGPDAQSDPAVNTFLSSCASGTAGANQGQYFFLAPDPTTLNQVFSGIATSVKKLRITQ
ncbi:MAG: VWA domain-containing protein [Alphaproteobacteria bacterium]